jgi:hypothetical protein
VDHQAVRVLLTSNSALRIEHGRTRDQHLLEEVFRLSCRYAGQAPGQAIFVNELRSALSANIGW